MLSSSTRLPSSTYRLQMTADFGFDAAAATADYLARLGVSHLYLSPYLQAGKGSTHGYDVVNHKRMNVELGGEAAHRRFCEVLAEKGLGQVLDIVPNHMAISGEANDLWWDVLENGRASRYATYFDIDWETPESKSRGKVLLPVLGEHYGPAVEKGELQIKRQGCAFTVVYYEHATPLAPESLHEILVTGGERAGCDWLVFLADSFARLPAEFDAESAERRHRFKVLLFDRLARLFDDQPPVAAAVDGVINEVNTEPDAMDRLLNAQHYRLAYWRTAGRELNYRRFFNIDTLAGIAIENEKVFNDTHTLLLRWVREGCLDGLRIDHIDGLRNPREYLQRLATAAPELWILVEKILAPGEMLPRDWPVAGTTGYDFLNEVGGLFVDSRNEAAMTDVYREFTGVRDSYDEIVRDSKHLMLREAFGGELNRLTNMLVEITERHRAYRDYNRHELHEALRELIVAMPVYRTYGRAGDAYVSEQDLAVLNAALNDARARRPDLDAGLWQFLSDLLTFKVPGEREGDFVMRFQQVSGPVMAKGVEDTAFYRYYRLVSLNEVGGDPGVFGLSVEEFHRRCGERQQRWPGTMLTTATHDTKRGEDTRTRISLLSEIPDRWAEAVRRWASMNEKHRRAAGPDRNDEYLIYQTLVGTWLIEIDRLADYLLKALRESKVHTNWVYPDTAYEEAVTNFAKAIVQDRDFIDDLERFVAPLRLPAYISSLSQALIKYTAPGVPDSYQGTELWDFSLVDPDNRRPVDYTQRCRMLDEVESIDDPARLWDCMETGKPKLFLAHRVLQFRRRRPELFGPAGAYEPLAVSGAKRDHAVAFMRGGAAVTIAPRLVLTLDGDWGDTHVALPAGEWRNIFTGQAVRGKAVLGELMRAFPVVLLAKQGEPS
ncbi:MAG TPA: malto-oligosyltrehalose synthase [Phycisphaerae bacterium]|nr:malto-oligosyltrehalose synthase [Phycisphaerae bacterium]